jgi:hypothetical protein
MSRSLFSLLLAVTFLAVGCKVPEMVILPGENQSGNTERVTRGGYDFLQSNKEDVMVTLSLRAARPSFLQAYVSVSNQSERGLSINPSDVRVVASGNGEESTYSAYSPTEAPVVVQQSAEGDYQLVNDFNRLSSSGKVRGQAEYGLGSGSYGSDSGDRSYLDVMLREGELGAGAAVGGYVYTPFNTRMKSLRIEVPVGGKTHTFRYTLRAESGN